MKRVAMPAVFLLLSACDQQESKIPDLPDQPDRLISSVSLQNDSKVNYVGRSSAILGITQVKPINGLQSISVGDDINDVHIAAIKCVFFDKDAFYSGEQFMWRGRWGCQAGRSQDEIDNAVKEDGTKLYDYIHVSPITLDSK